MFVKLKKKFLYMDTKIENKTLEEYRKIRNWSLSIFFLVLQILHVLENNISLLNLIFKNEDLSDFVLGLLINSSLFVLIYGVVFFIHQALWKIKNIDSCYLSGTWFHVFERQIDDGKNYVRAGYVKITQNYYDLSVDAYNYNISFSNRKLDCDKKDCSHWYFSLSELQPNGKITACFSKNKEYTECFSKNGIMELFVCNNDSKDKANEMYGVFSDSGSSTVKGNIRLFKYTHKKNINFDFLLNAPEVWVNHIKRQLYAHSQEDSFELRQLLYDAAKLLPSSRVSNTDISEKDGKKNLVTNYDLLIQKYIISRIKHSFPDAQFLGEENSKNISKTSDLVFVIDPIDGTTNFVNNCRFSCISVAILKNNEVIESAIYNPYLDEMFYAKKQEGAWLNDERLTIKDAPLSESIVGYTNCPYDENITDITFAFGKQLFSHSLDLRRMGASALELCYAACGRYQLYCEMILYPWDYMAASLIITEAGGCITDLDGNDVRIDKRSSVVAGCPTAHKDLLALYQKFISTTNYTLEPKTDLY